MSSERTFSGAHYGLQARSGSSGACRDARVVLYAEMLDELRRAGVGYVLVNGGGSGGGARGRESLRRFAHEVMPAFAER